MNHKALAMVTVAVILFVGANMRVIPNVSGTDSPSTGSTQGFDWTSLIGPTAAAGIALGGTRWVVDKWNQRKDINEIRKVVLENFNLFKNRAVMMDNFVGNLIMQYAKFGSSLTTEGHTLSALLPYLYTYKDLKHYSTTIHFRGLKDWDGKEITKEKIKQRFETLKESTEYYIDFNTPPIAKFGPQFDEFQKKFYNYSTVTEKGGGFKTLVGLYYMNDKLLDNFGPMWEYLMACFILINRIMYVTKGNDFVETITKFIKCEEYLFYFIEWFEEKLTYEEISLGKRQKAKKKEKEKSL